LVDTLVFIYLVRFVPPKYARYAPVHPPDNDRGAAPRAVPTRVQQRISDPDPAPRGGVASALGHAGLGAVLILCQWAAAAGMMVTPEHGDLHRMVDQLDPDQVRAPMQS
jgi:hypothetical protein